MDEERRPERYVVSDLPPEVEQRLGKAIVAAVLLLPDAERDAWLGALGAGLTGADVTIEDGWIVFEIEGHRPLCISEKAVGGNPWRGFDPPEV